MDIKIDDNGNARVYVKALPVTDSDWLFYPYLEEFERLDSTYYKGRDVLPEKLLNDLNFRKERCKRNFLFLCCSSMGNHLDVNGFLKMYLSYEEEQKTSHRERGKRYGSFVDCLLPEGSYEISQLQEIARRFARNIIDASKASNTEFRFDKKSSKGATKWIAWSYVKGKGQYLRIWICDREKYPYERTIPKRYGADIYCDEKTGMFCKKDSPNAVIKHKKGTLNLSAQKTTSIFNPTKTRLFNYSKGEFSQIRNWLIDCFVRAISCYKVDVKESLLFVRRKQKSIYSRWIKRCIVAENKAQRDIEDQLNYWYIQERMKAKQSFCNWKYEQLSGERMSLEQDIYSRPQTSLSRKLKDLFELFQKIFKSHEFVYQDTMISLQCYRCNDTERHFELLKKYFKESLFKVLQGTELYELNTHKIA